MQTETPSRIASIETAISNAARVPIIDMRGHDRTRGFVDARQAVWFICHDHLGYSFMELARLYNRDHTTIISGVRKLRKTDAGDKILQGIKKVCPDVLQKLQSGDSKTLPDWKF